MIICADLSSGASGDKLLGALLEINDALGAMGFGKLEALMQEILPQTKIARSTLVRGGVAATHIDVVDDAPQLHRHWGDIRRLIEDAPLTAGARKRALAAFVKIAEAEAQVHGTAVDKVHFHEVGASDSIVDIVASSVLLDALDVTEFFATPLALGYGTVECAHGTLPVPAPATVQIVTGLPVYAGAVASELTTPTGAALIAANATSFEPLPPCVPCAVGYGAGSKEFTGLPNVLRLIAANAREGTFKIEQVVLLETNVDHISPEIAASACERLMAEGALDVWQKPVVMKKGRLGQVLSVLCKPSQAGHLGQLVHGLTGSLGVRYRVVERSILPREQLTLETPFGPVRYKVAVIEEPLEHVDWVRPEHDDVASIANERGLPYDDVRRELVAFAQVQLAGPH